MAKVTVSDRIRKCREDLGLSQAEFAFELGTSQQTVCSWEKKPSCLRDRNLLAICLRFNVNEAWLKTGEGPEFKQGPSVEDVTRELQRALVKRIYRSLPQDVKEMLLDVCEFELAQREIARQKVRTLLDEVDEEPEK